MVERGRDITGSCRKKTFPKKQPRIKLKRWMWRWCSIKDIKKNSAATSLPIELLKLENIRCRLFSWKAREALDEAEAMDNEWNWVCASTMAGSESRGKCNAAYMQQVFLIALEFIAFLFCIIPSFYCTNPPIEFFIGVLSVCYQSCTYHIALFQCSRYSGFSLRNPFFHHIWNTKNFHWNYFWILKVWAG